MTPVEPQLHENAKLVIIAKDQPEYIPLPASVDNNGVVMTEWEPTAEELQKLFTGGRIRLWIYTYNHPLQPVMLDVVGGSNV